MKIKELFKELEEAEKRSNAIDEAWENDYENEELEAAWLEAYNKEADALNALITEIVNVTAGVIEPKTAKMMVISKRDELKALIERIA